MKIIWILIIASKEIIFYKKQKKQKRFYKLEIYMIVIRNYIILVVPFVFIDDRY